MMELKQQDLSGALVGSSSSANSSMAFGAPSYGRQQQLQQPTSMYGHHQGSCLSPDSLLVQVAATRIKEERVSRSPCSMMVNSTSSHLHGGNNNNNNIMNGRQMALQHHSNRVSSHEEWSCSSSPDKMPLDASSPVNGGGGLYMTTGGGGGGGNNGGGTNGFSPMSSGSYDTFSPNGREDLSPAGSVNGNTMDSFREGRRNNRASGPTPGVGGAGVGGPTSRQQEELCLVCGDRASGYHYNALTCEGCKGFFRRSITKNAVYQCKYGNNCEIDMYMRRKCQECRLKKCLKVGMRPECVVPEYQCAVKREAKRAQKDKDKPNSTTKDRVSSPDPIRGDPRGDDGSPRNMVVGTVGGSLVMNGPLGSSAIVNQILQPVNEDVALTVEEEELIERLCFFQEEYESPSLEDLQKLNANANAAGAGAGAVAGVGASAGAGAGAGAGSVAGAIAGAIAGAGAASAVASDQVQLPQTVSETTADGDSRYKHITEITIYTIRLIVEFAKRVPWFDTLLREDQITLLKACSSEVMMLRTARRYDISTDSIVFANDQPYTRDNYNSAGLGDCSSAIFHFCKQMCILKVDNAEYALVTAIVLFSERPNLLEPKKVEKIQDIYIEALRKYVIRMRPQCVLIFARLLSVLTELRTLGSLNSEMCFSLKLKNKQLPAFLAEIWDITS